MNKSLRTITHLSVLVCRDICPLELCLSSSSSSSYWFEHARASSICAELVLCDVMNQTTPPYETKCLANYAC